MCKKIFIGSCCIFFLCLNSTVSADDSRIVASNSNNSSGDSLRIAVADDEQSVNLRKWLEEIKPEAGFETVESPKKLKYWEQKVVRRNRRTTSK